MSTQASMLDLIEEKLRGATTKDVIIPQCCFKACRRAADFLLTLRYKDGSTDVYALCPSDMAKVREQHPSMLEKSQRQGVFLYAGH